jgi:hypothetical protein
MLLDNLSAARGSENLPPGRNGFAQRGKLAVDAVGRPYV